MSERTVTRDEALALLDATTSAYSPLRVTFAVLRAYVAGSVAGPAPAPEPRAWAVVDRKGQSHRLFFDDRETEARDWCVRENEAEDPLQPYTVRPLYFGAAIVREAQRPQEGGIVSTHGPWRGAPQNWIAPVHFCPSCGGSLNWKETVDVFDEPLLAGRCRPCRFSAFIYFPHEAQRPATTETTNG
jgi:hypothetical protein